MTLVNKIIKYGWVISQKNIYRRGVGKIFNSIPSLDFKLSCPYFGSTKYNQVEGEQFSLVARGSEPQTNVCMKFFNGFW